MSAVKIRQNNEKSKSRFSFQHPASPDIRHYQTPNTRGRLFQLKIMTFVVSKKDHEKRWEKTRKRYVQEGRKKNAKPHKYILRKAFMEKHRREVYDSKKSFPTK